MTIHSDIAALLTVCTQRQLELFTRMYGQGIPLNKSQQNTAKGQLQRTLLSLNEDTEKEKLRIKELENILQEKDGKIQAIMIENNQLQKEINFLHNKAPSDTCNCNQLLNALYAAGVDNWEGYEFALASMEE